MSVSYVPYGSVRVSRKWRTVLRRADKENVRFHVTSGHRTMAEQWVLFLRNMHKVNGRWVPKPGRPLTAYPSPTAPHIREGKAAHALDVNSLDGGEQRLENWVDNQGVSWENTVSGEAWHGELSEAELDKLYKIVLRDNRRDRLVKALAKLGRRKTSARGIRLIKEFEGFRATAYKPVPGDPWTIGYGHTGSDVHEGLTITRDRGEVLLKRDLKRFEKAVRKVGKATKYPFNQNQFDALVSATYNLGSGVLDNGRTLGNAIRRGKGVGDALLVYVKGGNPPVTLAGLVRRRKAERNLYRTKP